MTRLHVAFVVSLAPICLCFGGGCEGCQKTDVQCSIKVILKDCATGTGAQGVSVTWHSWIQEVGGPRRDERTFSTKTKSDGQTEYSAQYSLTFDDDATVEVSISDPNWQYARTHIIDHGLAPAYESTETLCRGGS